MIKRIKAYFREIWETGLSERQFWTFLVIFFISGLAYMKMAIRLIYGKQEEK